MTHATSAETPDFRALFEAAPGPYLILDPSLVIVAVNDAYLTATMTTRAGIVGRHLFDVFPDNPDDPNATGVRNLRASLERVLAHRRPDRMAVQKYDIRRPEWEGGGFEERHWSPLNSPVLGADGAVRYIIHWVEDVTEYVRLKERLRVEQDVFSEELKARTDKIEAEVFLRTEAVEASARLLQANARLTESERRYRFLADAVPQLIWTARPDGMLDYCNDRWTVYAGFPFEALEGRGWLQLIHRDDAPAAVAGWEDAIAGKTDHCHLEHRLRRHDGTYRWMLTTAAAYRDVKGAVVKWIGSTTDIHDRVTAEDRLRQAQRLQAVGQLAGGVAHEVNNMMTGVIGFADLILHGLPAEHPQRADLQEVLKAGHRAADVTRQLLAFSRQQVLNPTVVDVNAVVEDLSPALERLVGADRRLEVVRAIRQVRVRVDRTQIDQVLINLAANARDATGSDGLIEVHVRMVELTEERLRAHQEGETAPGAYTEIAVRDNGTGMPSEVVARAFEPFFTTKTVGQGTGLGLSMVYGIARQSGGYARIESLPGTGTTVSVYLPLVQAELTAPPAKTGDGRGAGRGEAILVVEDEGMVRTLAHRGLEGFGYTVFEAPNGLAALDFMGTHPGVVSLVLTDIVMPRMNGRDLADRIRERYRNVPVLFMSGYSGNEILQRGLMQAGAPFVQKPFTAEALAAAVRELLDRTRQALHARE